MDNLFFPKTLPPTLGGLVFNLLMLAAPFIGLWLGGGLVGL